MGASVWIGARREAQPMGILSAPDVGGGRGQRGRHLSSQPRCGRGNPVLFSAPGIGAGRLIVPSGYQAKRLLLAVVWKRAPPKWQCAVFQGVCSASCDPQPRGPAGVVFCQSLIEWIANPVTSMDWNSDSPLKRGGSQSNAAGLFGMTRIHRCLQHSIFCAALLTPPGQIPLTC